MRNRKPITPGVYPTLYRCVICGEDLKKKDIWTTKALQLDDTTCVCEPCIPTWEKKKLKPLRDFITKPEFRESWISQCLDKWHKHTAKRDRKAAVRRRQTALAEAEGHLVDFVDASLGDPTMRNQLRTIAAMDSFHRGSLLGTIIAEAEIRNAPKEFLLVLHHLTKDEFAAKLGELLDAG